MEIATGKVTDRCYTRYTNTEFLAFLELVAKSYPRVLLHVVCDNDATHKHANVKSWLKKNPRVRLLFTPTSGSWLNMVEIFFGIITRQAIRRGAFTSVRDLEAAITTDIDGWNDRAHPFTWTKNADTIIAHARPSNRKRTSNTGHQYQRILQARPLCGTVKLQEVSRRCPQWGDIRVAELHREMTPLSRRRIGLGSHGGPRPCHTRILASAKAD